MVEKLPLISISVASPFICDTFAGRDSVKRRRSPSSGFTILIVALVKADVPSTSALGETRMGGVFSIKVAKESNPPRARSRSSVMAVGETKRLFSGKKLSSGSLNSRSFKMVSAPSKPISNSIEEVLSTNGNKVGCASKSAG